MRHTLSAALLMLLLPVLLPTSLHAQPWRQGPDGAEYKNFYDIQRTFNEYWQGRDFKERGKGWKPFKRWEWFWEQRVYPSGEFPNPMQLYDEYTRYTSTHPRNGNNATFSGNWSSMGPSESPGGYAGLGRVNCVRVDPYNSALIWAGSASGGLWKSTDAGATWSSNTDQLPTLGVTDVAINPLNTSIMYIATGDGDAQDTYSVGVLKSTDGGTTWATTGLNWNTSQQRVVSRLLLHPLDPNILLAAGSGIFKSTNGGTTWTQVSTTVCRDMERKPGSTDTLYASGNSSQVLRSINGGDSWSSSSAGLPGGGQRLSLGVTPANPNYVYAVISASNSGLLAVCRSTDAGDTWSVRANSPNLLGWEANGSDVGGQGWYDLAIAVSQSNADEVFVGGVNNWKSIDGGSSWTLSTFWYNNGYPTAHADQHDLHFVPGTSTLYAGNDGGVYRTTDRGSSWQWLGSGLKITQFYRLGTSATNPNVVIAGSQDNGTKMLSGSTWYDVLGGDGMEALVDYSNEAVMYGSLYYGAIFKSMNGGSSFFPTTNGITETGGWITPYIIHPTDPLTLFAGFSSVWKTIDGGASWFQISTPFGTLSILNIAPSDPATLYAGRGASLYRTTNGGASTWTTMTTPPGASTLTSLAIHPTNPRRIWVTSSGYSAGNKIFQSTDGGSTWTNISGSLPNVPANSVVYQKNSPDRLYVGTDIGVYYRDLTVPDWQSFNTGLPNVVIDELEIHEATGRIRAATYGRGIWESDLIQSQGIIIAASPSSIPFGRVEVGTGSDTLSMTITSYGTDTLTISAISEPGSSFHLMGRPTLPLRLASLQSLTLTATFAPTAHGDVTDSIVILSDAANMPRSVVSLSGKGVILGRAQPGVMYAVSGPPAVGQLYNINTVTGAATAVGSTGVAELDGLAIRPSTQQLYAIYTNSFGSTLYRVSSLYGDALMSRPFAIPNMRAIAFSAGDTLFAATTIGHVYRINVDTGDTTYIGTATGKPFSGLSFSPTSGKLWASVRPAITGRDSIYTVNTQTGATTTVGRTLLNLITPSIAFDPNGKLYALIGSGAQTNSLYTLDTLTANATLIGSTGVTALLAIAMRPDSLVTGVEEQEGEIPESYTLQQNYPNPFNPVTEIRYGLPQQSQVRLVVYNLLGQVVARLFDGIQSAGYHAVVWNGTNTRGSSVASGVYFYALEAKGLEHGAPFFTDSKKMLFLK